MSHRRLWMGVLYAGMVAAAPASAATPRDQARDAKALAARIDEFLAAKWDEAKVEPAAPSEDAEFFRRVNLDLNGKIPKVSEVREFLDDADPDKRDKAVARLLAGPGYVNHAVDVWRALLLPEANSDFQIRFLRPDFENWLRERFRAGVGYDKVVRELITAKLGDDPRRGFSPYNQQGTTNPLAFYSAKGGKPENLAASSARLFLGVRIECAQCHDHPFARWKREQFWSYAAFFGGVSKQGPDDQFGPIRELPDRREMAIPGTDRVVQANFLDGGDPQWKYKVGPRVTLADWMTAADNPYFARAAANRVWAQLFGVGLVDPVDDLNDDNPPSHPELLDELTHQFAAHDFDLKFLLRAITASRAYQRSSAATASPSTAEDPHLFARKAMKGLTAEQLFESLAEATGYPAGDRNQNPFNLLNNDPRTEFLDKFASVDERPTDHQTSILHALSLMNGKIVTDATSLEKGATLGAIADSPFLDTPGKIEALYLAALSRKPRPEESARLEQYLERGGPTRHPKKALADVFWALLNGSEFLLNH